LKANSERDPRSILHCPLNMRDGADSILKQEKIDEKKD